MKKNNNKLVTKVDDRDLIITNFNGKKISHKLWCIKITIVTIFLAGLFSFISNTTVSISSIIATVFLLMFLIVLSIIFDGIAVAVTSADKKSFTKFVNGEQNKYYNIGCFLIDNQEIVANICADVIGDIFSIISGSCSVSIVLELLKLYPIFSEQILTIFLSSVVAGITVGGKAFMKSIALKNSNSYILFTSKIIAIFVRRKNVFRKNPKSRGLKKTK